MGPASHLSEFTWYSRLAVWVGALILTVQAVTGKGAGFMTALAVVALSCGLLAFVTGLVRDARLPRLDSARAAMVPETAEPGSAEYPSADKQEVPVREAEWLGSESDTGSPEPPPTVAPSIPMEKHVEEHAAAIATDHVAVAAGACKRCDLEILPGQLRAACPLCASEHHAACWMENLFHCARPGCHGRGDLAAPLAKS